ncbi:TetR/AcrR family transcriptional regulator [Agromyces sp. S2-1-8]|uniref:TetR/AcrR family transcriptional regulator n=1 Tax=Agromyces sp. S2-1-8 TaxID=2897180 RepID=UPI001E347D5A|nr:TetR/AcrR family transcriptional regulator [Agromyces sp. S2-1-8]MCD5346101.1 TetR/AcrR family transcriptional regulator [Agromyces sp. S2-1-8]
MGKHDEATGGGARSLDGAVAPTRQARSALTRARILDAAQAAFVEQGIAAVSLRDVAERAGLSHPGVLRHYASLDALLGAVVERLDDANADWIEHEPVPVGTLGAAALARRNAAAPGYLELFTALSGEATSRSHPAHDMMRARYARVRASIADELVARAAVAASDASWSATLLIAGWDGLQVQQRYAPDSIDLVGELEARERRLMGAPARTPSSDTARPGGPCGPTGPGAGAAPEGAGGMLAPTVLLEQPEPPGAGGGTATGAGAPHIRAASARGARRHEAIVEAATELFARDGFTGTSLAAIAGRTGISKATLLHHVGSKAELLTEVLRHRDRLTITGGAPARGGATDRLRSLPATAERTAAAHPGLVELYAVLSCEGATPGHPAHEYFAHRFRETRRYFASLLRGARDEGSLAPDRDPGSEAAWLLAVWDGLQIQSLYDPAVEVARLLRRHLDDVLGPAEGRAPRDIPSAV